MQMLSVLCSERDKVWRYHVKHDICSALHLVCSSQLLQTGFESRFVDVRLLAHGSVDTCAASAPWARQPTASTLCEYFIQINFRVICPSKTREQYWKTWELGWSAQDPHTFLLHRLFRGGLKFMTVVARLAGTLLSSRHAMWQHLSVSWRISVPLGAIG